MYKTFLGGADSVHCLNISEIENADNVDKETRKVDLNSETLGTSVALPSSPTHIGLNANEQTLAVCVKLNNVPHIYLYDSRAFLNPSGNDVKPFLEIPGSTPPGVSIKVQAFFFVELIHAHGLFVLDGKYHKTVSKYWITKYFQIFKLLK